MRTITTVLACLIVVVTGVRAEAQSFEAGLHLSSAQWSEFDGNDRGIGGRVTWKPISLIGIDADLTWYPSEFPPDTIAFSRNRIEGLFGMTIGPRIDRVRPFAKAAAGFLKSNGPPGGIPCIAIFPPPLACAMAAGPTMAAYEVGGGIEIDATARTFIRADVTQRLLNYPGPTFRGPGLAERVDDDFLSGAMRFTIGAGIRF